MVSNLVLLLLSFFFYLWGNGNYVLLLLISVLVNLYISKILTQVAQRKMVLFFGISFNVLLLFYFKYASFFMTQVNNVFGAGFTPFSQDVLPSFLPIGISFYTFMAISYLVDVYRKKHKAANLVNFATFLTFFPHIVAGPIVRYQEISHELSSRRHYSLDSFFEGITRFCFGLGKKVILANGLGVVADKIFALPITELSPSTAWIGIVLYTLQIFYDFSGYTDMAIGLAAIFGFHFPENFNFPYRAQTMTEFWQRWHMTLRRWFVDYVYIPLGGSRKGNMRTYLNIFVVFLLTGFWHGASWTFIVWGIYHGLILMIERFLLLHYKWRLSGIFGNAVTLLLVMIGWVFFRRITMGDALIHISALFGLVNPQVQYYTPQYFLDTRTMSYALIAGVLALIPFHSLLQKVSQKSLISVVVIKGTVAFGVLLYSIAILSKTQFTPFIYFNF